MLLRSRLYPDAAAAAAAAAAAKSTRFAKRSKSAPGPSKATAAAVAAAAAAAAAAAHLPHIILKSQLYTVLADKTAVDRDVEQLRQNGKAKLFKLSTGERPACQQHAPQTFNCTWRCWYQPAGHALSTQVHTVEAHVHLKRGSPYPQTLLQYKGPVASYCIDSIVIG